MTTETEGRCSIRDCLRPRAVYIGFGEYSIMGAWLCDRHKPTAEQALRRGVVANLWKIHGNYASEIASKLSTMTGHKIRESTVREDLRWLGLTEADRAAEARVNTAVRIGEAGPNVVALRRAPW